MKALKYILLLISFTLFFICANNSWAANSDSTLINNSLSTLTNTELISLGNEQYRDNQFKLASNSYQTVLDRGGVSPDLYYNLGNCYYKQNETSKAILNYERALVLNPSHTDAKFNLQQAKRSLIDKIEPAYTPFFSEKYNQLIMLQSIDQWAWFSIVAFVVFLLSIAFYLFARTSLKKKLGFFTSLIFILLTVGFFLFARSSNEVLNTQKSAIVFEPSVTIYSSPSVVGKELYILHEGIKVKILDKDADWYKIRLPNNLEGWINASSLVVI